MNPERWQKVRGLFDAVADSPPDTWSEQLMKLCPDDASMRLEVLTLLEADADRQGCSTGLAVQAPDLLVELADREEVRHLDAWIGRRLGVWRLVRILGHGGMGVVYLAERDDGEFRQHAAIKVMRPGADSGRIMQRFRAERQILAGLDHPNVARLLDGGVSQEGVPWFALEYIDGVSLTRWCDQSKLGIRERLSIFLDVCSAVTHAHERLVVHRDLKPTNILVDTGGHVKLLDFGIAKLLDDGNTESRTGTAFRLLTPEYAAPEQIQGGAITTSVDIYALGLVLFELLTGFRPYRTANTTPAVVASAVLSQEPMRASNVFTRSFETSKPEVLTRAASRGSTSDRLRKQLRGDLDAILLKALRKEPAHRYRAVSELATDIRCYLQFKPVAARYGSRRYRLGRFVQRHALAVALSGFAGLTLVAGSVVSLRLAQVARTERTLAQEEARKARSVADFLRNLFVNTDPVNTDGHDPRASELLEKGARDLEMNTGLDASARASMLIEISGAFLSLDQYDRALELAQKADEAARSDGGVRIQIASALALGRVLNQARQLDTALSNFQRAMQLYESSAIDDPILVADISSYTAVPLYNNGDSEEALKHLEHAFQLIETHAPGSPEQYGMLELYANLLAEMGREDEAVIVTESAYRSALGNPDLPLSELSIACAASGHALLKAGRPAEAEVRFREALEVRQRIYGVDHLATANSIHNISIALRNQGKYAEAAEYAMRRLEMSRKSLPAGSSRIASAMVNAGIIYSAAGDHHKALALLSEGMANNDWLEQAPAQMIVNAYMSAIVSLESQSDHARALDVAEEAMALMAGDDPMLSGPLTYDLRLRYARLKMRLNEQLSATACLSLEAIKHDGTVSDAQRRELGQLIKHCVLAGSGESVSVSSNR